MDLELLRYRAEIMQKIRLFFIERDYLETDTPALSPSLIPETCLEVFKTEYLEPWSTKVRSLYLVPSPEIYMKKIIAQHKISVFQLSKCYRNVESCGNMHSPEFTMLEYYTMNASYTESAQITEDFLRSLHPRFNRPFTYVSMNEAFLQLAGFSLLTATEGELSDQAKKLGLAPESCKNWNDLYQLIFVHSVEPRLYELEKGSAGLFLTDYPIKAPCLAKDTKDGLSKERWELYIDGIELANCYSEQIDSIEVKKYFEEEGKLKESARVPHTSDSDYWKTFVDFPPCSGVALGVDRLLMLLAERKSIDSILPFPL